MLNEQTFSDQLRDDLGQTAIQNEVAPESPKEGFPESGPASAPAREQEVDTARYEYDAGFQTKIAALVLRDATFNERTTGLVAPEFFESMGEAALVRVGLHYYRKYRRCPDLGSLTTVIKEALESKLIPSRAKPEIKETLRKLLKADIGDRDFVVDKVSEFAQQRAMERAIIKSVEHLERREFPLIEKVIKDALMVGALGVSEYNYFNEVGSRTAMRKAIEIGGASGIPSGIAAMDAILYHNGWGRGELTVYMGGAKVGKSTALGNSGLIAALKGYNVLYITLEMSVDIAAMRNDANLAGMTPQELRAKADDAEKAIAAVHASSKCGQYIMHEFPSGTFKPADLRRLVNYYKAKGITFDLVVVDYLDIMVPDYRYDDDIANSKSVWVSVRAIAQEEKFAILSATQTNRDGYKASTAKAEHVAEDFNKIRTADLVISINKTEEEERMGQARLYFAASRNQQGGICIHVKQDLERMRFVTQVLKIDG